MSYRYRGELLLVTVLLASAAGLMALMRGALGLLGGFTWTRLALALGGGLLLAFSLLLALFIIYQLDRAAGRITKPIALFEMELLAKQAGGDGDG